jgi:IclR family transcriptional regulator, pca regulon regulatory protein
MPGSRLPAYCASMGRVLLAALGDDDARLLIESSERPHHTPLTRTDPAQLMLELAIVRAQGYALIDQELELGLRSIAVPLANARGKVVAALNIGAPAAQITPELMAQQYLPPLKLIAQQLRPLLP